MECGAIEAAVTVTVSHLEAVRCLDCGQGDEAGRSDGPECITGELCVEAVVSGISVLGGHNAVAEGPVMLSMELGFVKSESGVM